MLNVLINTLLHGWSAMTLPNAERAAVRGCRIAVETGAPWASTTAPDYADAFAVRRSGSDPRSAEQWARDGFERLPSSSRRFGLLAHRWLLGFHLGPFTSVDHIFGWRIVSSRPELLHLQAQGPRLTGHMLWQVEDERLVMTTFVQYENRFVGPAIWAIVGIIHRDAVPGLLALAVRYDPMSA